MSAQGSPLRATRPEQLYVLWEAAMAKHAPAGRSPATWGVVTVLLVAAIMGTLWVPIYARTGPKLGPFPFFYWYQLIWVPVSAVLCWICYLILRSKPRNRGIVPR
jgi:uncharacterized protein DUF3311